MNARRAPAARLKMEIAQEAISALARERDEFVLAALEGGPGAEKALAAHRAKFVDAERQFAELAGAVRLAERLDRQADAYAAVEMRAEQLAVFEKASAARVAAMSEVLALIGKAAQAYTKYVRSTETMATALPTGTSLPVMHYAGFAGSFLGNGEALIAAEAFRMSNSGSRIPIAKHPMLSAGDNVAAMRPGAEVLAEAHAAVLDSIKAQIERLDRDAIAAAGAKEKAA